MSDENLRKRKKTEAEEPDVVGHIADDPTDADPERKRKRKRKHAEQPESDELGRKRK